MSTVFEKMFTGEKPVDYLYKNDKHGVLIFPDGSPAAYGHFLVVPREPVDHWHDLSPTRAAQLSTITNLACSHAMERLNDPRPNRIGQIVSGYGVAHAHMHGLPSYERGDFANLFDPDRASNPERRIGREQLERTLADLAFPRELAEQADRLLDRYAEPEWATEPCLTD